MTNLHRLFAEQGQSPWLDNLRRDAILDGSLKRIIESGIRGLTSNPTIFQKAITSSQLYDEEFFESLGNGKSVEAAYWDLVTTDIADACDLFAALYTDSDRRDGFVSVEVGPALCHDAQATISAARELSRRVNRPNVMIKIPATDAGLEAITTVLSEGISVNVTLIFGLRRYLQVVQAHQAGLELLASRDPSLLGRVSSVASFFISRVDNAIDPLLGSHVPLGRSAIAQAQLAYTAFCNHLASPEWESLASLGAVPQRPLWASTSTKNPSFSPTLYVDELIAPQTVNTLPDATLTAFEQSGTVARTIRSDIQWAQGHLELVNAEGINLEQVAEQLEREGLQSFQASFDDLITSLEAKAAAR